MTKQARNYSIKNDSMSYFPGEHMTGPATDASGIYRGWNQTSPSNLLQGQCQRMELEEETQSRGGAGTAEGGTLITLQINALCWQGSAVGKASNQIASPEPCPSVGVTIHTCKSTSTEQRLKGRGRQKIARGKRLQLRLRIRVASIIINIKTEILPHSSSQVLCFKGEKKSKPQIPLCRGKKKKLPKFCFITEQLFFQVLAKPLQSLSWLV